MRDTGSGAEYCFATATPPQEFDLPLEEGITTVDSGSKYFKTQDNVCTVSLRCTKPPDGITSDGVVFTMPAGFRPVRLVAAPVFAVTSSNVVYGGMLRVWPEGFATIWMPIVSANEVVAQITFITAYNA